MENKSPEYAKKLMDEIAKEINEEYKDQYKLVYVDKTYWNNCITKRKGEVRNLYFLGINNRGGRPYIITRLKVDGNEYVLNETINHTNVTSSHGFIQSFVLNKKHVALFGHEFCNPITPHHIYNNPNIDKILKGQLMGQNGNSPMCNVVHVFNNEIDYVIKRHNGRVLKANASPFELITRLSVENVPTNVNELANVLSDLRLPKDDSEIMVKFREKTEYVTIEQSDLEKVNHKLSRYYPIIEYNEIENIVDNIPKAEMDFTVIGLGSAGTGVLDQVARSTYFKNYFLIDFDTVEKKNLRNQWYTYGHRGCYKTNSCRGLMQHITNVTPHTFNGKFQNAMLDRYKSKYVVSGFDNLECRLELLDYCTSGKFETEYLIDLRYLDYACSIYFINLKDEKQVKYYRNLLLSDIAEFEKVDENNCVQTKEQLKEFWIRNDYHNGGCEGAFDKFFKDEFWCRYQTSNGILCGRCNEGCMDYLWSLFEKHKPKIPLVQEEESSCVRQNFIDIYKYASSFVFAAIREIESDNAKPFTHIEAQTDVIPSSMIVRK